jgi:hypothetical protein
MHQGRVEQASMGMNGRSAEDNNNAARWCAASEDAVCAELCKKKARRESTLSKPHMCTVHNTLLFATLPAVYASGYDAVGEKHSANVFLACQVVGQTRRATDRDMAQQMLGATAAAAALLQQFPSHLPLLQAFSPVTLYLRLTVCFVNRTKQPADTLLPWIDQGLFEIYSTQRCYRRSIFIEFVYRPSSQC